jgi:glycosyltransferase involved in cell wall biosynthesis
MIATHWALGTWSRSVHQYVALTSFVRNQLIAGGFPENRISIKPNFIVDPLLSTAYPRLDSYFIYVGRLAKEKGLQVLFKSWNQLKDKACLKVVGGGPMPYGLSVPEGIEMLGEQPVHETYRLIAGAKALILPAQWPEPFGRVVIEAYALGTPVIASMAGALPELVEHNVTGLLFTAGSSSALAAAIDRLSRDAGLRARLRQQARQAYLRSFTDEANYESLIAIYKRAIDLSTRT